MDINHIDIDISLPEFSTIIHNNLNWIESFAKNYEMLRRQAAISVAITQKEKQHIQQLSEAFMYILKVEDGSISLERVPSSEDDYIADSVIEETKTIISHILPEQIQTSMGNAKAEIFEIVKPQVIQEIREMLGGAF